VHSSYLIAGTEIPAPALTPGLYVVATPIGNLGDISMRALATLAACDIILAEDTRVTRNLLQHYGIRTPMRAYHEHNARDAEERLISQLKAGERLSLVSDAGTPLVSDPGQGLVSAAIRAGIPVIPIPGASATLTALVAAGLPAERFFFEGFLPPKAGERRRRIREIEAVPATLVFYEAPHRAAESLADLAEVLGDRPAVLARELTKKFETFRRGTLPSLAAALAAEPQPKGEIVLLVAPPQARTELTDADIDAALALALESHSPRDAAQIVAAELGLPKRRVYARALQREERR
jgi:16S rRNA (cytidine1402-2'-O)-methyltransferase